MKRPDRFFLSTLGGHEVGDLVCVGGREGGHAVRVKRQRSGGVVELFDGAGRRARAVVTTVDRRGGMTVRIEAASDEPPPAGAIHLACAVPKGDRMETLLDMVTQLGATRITPIVFAHSVASDARHERWRRVLVEACKQSGRNHLPRLDGANRFDEWLSTGIDAGWDCWLADPHGRLPPRGRDVAGCVIVVGPEGGLSDEERRAAIASGFTPVAFGGNVLRVETAAVAAVVAAVSRYG